ncbi:hypothetical protein BLJAPNOD_05285 [Ensifer sp. M14]|nr:MULTISPECIES: hypothetical protein [Sinorhizobium/Ensifer group]RDL48058.1 hypothetical protein BLJAPNOD_05285 [Ensifer sp. M14]
MDEHLPTMNPAATHDLPGFVRAPGEIDFLFYGVAIFLVVIIFLFGAFYLRLHHLPEHLAHKGQKAQYEIVAVLSLIAMFTHNNLFWIAALLLALLPIPDLSTPLTGIARSLEEIANRKKRREAVSAPTAPELGQNSVKQS